MTISLLKSALGCLLLLAPLQAQRADPGAQAAMEMEGAVVRVKEIVNQPVTRLPMGPDDRAAKFHPGWFHAGAITPNFDSVDIRTSQECRQYSQWPYVTSDITPGVMFIGSELEFNPMTKLFYTDRSQPKKKLTEQEMLEINDLYRVIGSCLKQLRALRAQSRGDGSPAPDAKALGMMAPLVLSAESDPAKGGVASPQERSAQGGSNPWALGAFGFLLILALVWIQVRRRRG